jgi:hypothetical protein
LDLTDEELDLIIKALDAYPGHSTSGFLLASLMESIRPDKNKLAKEAHIDQMHEDQRRTERDLRNSIIMPMAKIKMMQDSLRSKGTYHRCERPHVPDMKPEYYGAG